MPDVPSFYDPVQLGDWHYAPDPRAIEAAGAEHPTRPAEDDARRVVLLLVDCQRDFAHPAGTLFVGGREGDGAQQDCRRIVELLYGKGERISQVIATLDTHHPDQIFFSRFWIDREGRHPAPFTLISTEALHRGHWLVDPAMAHHLPEGRSYAWAARQAEFYADALEREGRYGLIIWPDHCLEGTPGHGLLGAVHAAIHYHAGRRRSPPVLMRKGEDVWTESYSVFRPEVPVAWDGTAIAKHDRTRMTTLLSTADEILVAGEASSHCVRWSVNDLVATAATMGPEVAGKLTILTDCMSAVVSRGPDGAIVPELDFTAAAEAAYADWAAAGARIARSTDW